MDICFPPIPAVRGESIVQFHWLLGNVLQGKPSKETQRNPGKRTKRDDFQRNYATRGASLRFGKPCRWLDRSSDSSSVPNGWMAIRDYEHTSFQSRHGHTAITGFSSEFPQEQTTQTKTINLPDSMKCTLFKVACCSVNEGTQKSIELMLSWWSGGWMSNCFKLSWCCSGHSFWRCQCQWDLLHCHANHPHALSPSVGLVRGSYIPILFLRAVSRNLAVMRKIDNSQKVSWANATRFFTEVPVNCIVVVAIQRCQNRLQPTQGAPCGPWHNLKADARATR